MLPPKCFTCGHILADIELEYMDTLTEINNNFKLLDNEKEEARRKLVNKLIPDIRRYCCRSSLISFVSLIDVII